MIDNIEHITELMIGYLNDELNDSERKALNDWVAQSDKHRQYFETLTQGGHLRQVVTALYQHDNKKAWRRFHASLNRRRMVTFWRGMAAAAVILLMVTGAWLWFGHHRQTAKPPIAKHILHDAPPGGNKAVLTLANGSHIILDNAHNGQLASQGKSKVVKLGSGLLAYQAERASGPAGLKHHAGSDVSFNTLSTPRGGQYRLLLPDGTAVWLNSASSIRYPTSFTGKERKVSISGEAYFEVARDPSRAFTVQLPAGAGGKDGISIRVLGTHFNVMTYPEEPEVQATLLQGKVKVEAPGITGSTLLPGEQAVVSDGGIRIRRGADTAAVTGWKNGLFYFDHVTLQTMMRAFARWYNVKVAYEGSAPHEVYFSGTMQKNIPLSVALDYLAGDVFRYTIEDGTVTISR